MLQTKNSLYVLISLNLAISFLLHFSTGRTVQNILYVRLRHVVSMCQIKMYQRYFHFKSTTGF